MGNADIERLVDAQAAGALIVPGDVPVESTIPRLAELDIRRSKSGLAGGSLLCEPLEMSAPDPLPLEADRSLVDLDRVAELADNLDPQVLNVAGAPEGDLGLVQRHDA